MIKNDPNIKKNLKDISKKKWKEIRIKLVD